MYHIVFNTNNSMWEVRDNNGSVINISTDRSYLETLYSSKLYISPATTFKGGPGVSAGNDVFRMPASGLGGLGGFSNPNPVLKGDQKDYGENFQGVNCDHESHNCSKCHKDFNPTDIALVYSYVKIEMTRHICKHCMVEALDRMFGIEGRQRSERLLYEKDET